MSVAERAKLLSDNFNKINSNYRRNGDNSLIGHGVLESSRKLDGFLLRRKLCDKSGDDVNVTVQTPVYFGFCIFI